MKTKKLKSLILLVGFISLLNLFYLTAINPGLLNSGQIENQEKYPQTSSSVTRDWNVTWGLIDSSDIANDVVVDSNGFIYVVGTTLPMVGGELIVLLQYDSEGNYMWNRTIGFGTNNQGNGIAIDSEGFIYVAGKVLLGAYDNACLVKYDSSGDQIWNRTWGGGTSFDGGYGIDIDSNDNIYIAGYCESDGVNIAKLLLLKYNKTGHLQWAEKWDPGTGFNQANDVAIDSLGNIYIVGNNGSGTFEDVALAKYDSGGNQLWNRTWGTLETEIGKSLAIDSSDNIYIIGYNTSSGDYDIILLKYDSSGDIKWISSWNGGGLGFNIRGYGIDIDSNDYIYANGFKNRVEWQSEDDSILIRFNTEGELLWNETLGGVIDEEGYGIAVENKTGNIYTVGRSQLSSYQIHVIKYGFQPGDVFLYSDAGNPDNDGSFTLMWNASLYAKNYSLYYSTTSCAIDTINGAPWIQTIMGNSVPLASINTGNNYFIIVARNNRGNTTSNCITIVVATGTGDPPGTPTVEIPGYDLYILLSTLSIVSVFLIRKYHRN